jgi:hypothetical protein
MPLCKIGEMVIIITDEGRETAGEVSLKDSPLNSTATAGDWIFRGYQSSLLMLS